jgi:2OG-Fe(II) oxygenase superfamily
MNRSEMTAHILNRVDGASADLRAQWARTDTGTGTRFCAIEGLMPDDVAMAIYAAFPKDGSGFLARRSFRESKRTSFSFDDHPLILADITFAMQNPEVASRIGEIVGVPAMEPDPHLYAGGLSMMFENDFLNPHIDNSHEQTRSKYRRINLLYYVTPEWQRDFGGNLELWDSHVTQPVTIESRFNRLVLMETNKTSWHSVSPVMVNRPRCCVSNYYFSEASPTGEAYYHVTSFTGRPGQTVRRVAGTIDNLARGFAREKLRMGRKTDKGYQGTLAERD